MKTLSSAQRVEHLQKIQSAYSKCKEYSDDKVQLAMQTYEMVSAGASCSLSLLPSCPRGERMQVYKGVWTCERVYGSV